MRTNFTDLQIRATGELPFAQREGEYEVAERALQRFGTSLGIDKNYALAELQSLKETLVKGNLGWEFYRGKCLGVNKHRVHTALVPYAIHEKLGRVYRVQMPDIPDFMCIVHSWRYHGVTVAGLDKELEDYGLHDEVPYEVFREAVDTMWCPEPDKERIIFQDNNGSAVSIYGTETIFGGGVHDAILESIDLSSYETMCLHVVSCMMELPKSVVLLGVSKDECYILDKTGRNESDIMSIFSDLVFSRWYFSRYIKFTGEVTRVEAGLEI